MSALKTLARSLPGLPVVAGPALRTAEAVLRLPGYVGEWRRYRSLAGDGAPRVRDAYPQLLDRSHSTPYDPHYFHQAVWAAHRIGAEDPAEHVDVGSQALFVGMLSVTVPVTFVDIRPLEVTLPGLTCVQGSLERLPLADRSTPSVSCLHVVEHVGLGRYGDPLDPAGTRRACAELQRVLAPGGSLYLSTPVGRERVCFNAHRIHDPRTIVGLFAELELVAFAIVDDDGLLRTDLGVDECSDMSYSCGMFWFQRTAVAAE